ncbi:MAG TPA: Hsp20/alpha crystallin family protein [Chloroflexia bacterium]
MYLDSSRPGSRSAWRDLMSLQDEMNRMLGRGRGAETWGAAYPAVNVWTSEESVVVTAELPGVSMEELDISVVGDTLTIRGTRNPEQLKEGESFHRRERGHGKFVRVVQLPFRIEADEVSATLRNGTLNITLPRANADRPRKIQIKTA